MSWVRIQSAYPFSQSTVPPATGTTALLSMLVTCAAQVLKYKYLCSLYISPEFLNSMLVFNHPLERVSLWCDLLKGRGGKRALRLLRLHVSATFIYHVCVDQSVATVFRPILRFFANFSLTFFENRRISRFSSFSPAKACRITISPVNNPAKFKSSKRPLHVTLYYSMRDSRMRWMPHRLLRSISRMHECTAHA